MATKTLGLVLPLEKGYGGYFNSTTQVMEQMRSNLTNLLLTKKGERMMQPTFGCDVHSLLFEAQTDNTQADVRAAIASAVREWMPFIIVDSVTTTLQQDVNKVFVKIVFRLSTNEGITDSIVLVY